MMRFSSLVVLVAIGAVSAIACSKNDAAKPPPTTTGDSDPLDDTAQADAGDRDSVSFDDGTMDSTSSESGGDGTVGDASEGGTTDSAATDGSADSGPPPVCPTTFTDKTPTSFTHPGAGTGEKLAAITWDELTMAWTTVDSGGKIVVHTSDRTSKDGAFTADNVLAASLGPFADDKVALSADGLSMIYVSEDHTVLHLVTRPSRGAAFDPATATTAPFAYVTAIDGEGSSTKKIGDVVWSRDGSWLIYSDLSRTSGPSIMLSVRLSDGKFDLPNSIDDDELAISSGKRRRPTGISADKLTLFYFDEVTNKPRIAVRTPDTALFPTTYPFLPAGDRVMPSTACDRFYFDWESATASKGIYKAP